MVLRFTLADTVGCGFVVCLTTFGTAFAALESSTLERTAQAAPQAAGPEAAQSQSGERETADQEAATSTAQRLDIFEYRIEGVNLLSQLEVDEVVYPFLGPGRSLEDVETARATLEKAYFARGYQTVIVEIPPQRVKDGVVQLKVTEGKVGRLRVRGSRYFSLEGIKAQAPSLAEGTVPDFKRVSDDIVALNMIPDRRVTPALRAGVTPGTVDVDLNVEDDLPLHGSLELNNRHSTQTTELRANASLRYENLWQAGHSLSLNYQVAPERPKDAEVLSASYLARLPHMPSLSLLAYGVKNDSDISTLGDLNVVGRGEIIGLRALLNLPARDGFFHTLSFGADYKHFTEALSVEDDKVDVPISYVPFTMSYGATWQAAGLLTQFNAATTFHVRGLGSGPEKFDMKRFKAQPSFVYLRLDASNTWELARGWQLVSEIEAQASSQPLISSEQLSAGGIDTVRGYFESEASGDHGVLGSIELRTPSLAAQEWRLFAFVEGGWLGILEALPEQDSSFELASTGIGSRIRLFDHLNGIVDLGVPLIGLSDTEAHDATVSFRLWGEF